MRLEIFTMLVIAFLPRWAIVSAQVMLTTDNLDIVEMGVNMFVYVGPANLDRAKPSSHCPNTRVGPQPAHSNPR